MQGISKVRHSTIDALAGVGEEKDYPFPEDFHVNYVKISVAFQGATDEPTEAEKLAKMGTFNVETEDNKGTLITNQDFDDLFNQNILEIHKGQNPYLVGDGGGDNDFHVMVFYIHAGCLDRIQSTCGWAKEQKGKLKINWGADTGLDNTRVRVTFYGYEGSKPKYVGKVKFLSEAGVSGEEGSEIKLKNGNILQSVFAFETTERNLATIQTLDGYTVKELRLYQNGQDLSDRWYATELQDGITDTTASLHEYASMLADPHFDGMGIPITSDKAVLKVLAGASDAMRVYTRVLERI